MCRQGWGPVAQEDVSGEHTRGVSAAGRGGRRGRGDTACQNVSGSSSTPSKACAWRLSRPLPESATLDPLTHTVLIMPLRRTLKPRAGERQRWSHCIDSRCQKAPGLARRLSRGPAGPAPGGRQAPRCSKAPERPRCALFWRWGNYRCRPRPFSCSVRGRTCRTRRRYPVRQGALQTSLLSCSSQ